MNAGYITEGYGLLATVDEDTITLQRYTASGKSGNAYVVERYSTSPVNIAPVLGDIGEKSVDELSELSFTATATDEYIPAGTLTFSLDEAPEGAVIDAGTGAFSWTPTEAQGPGE